MAEFHQCPQCLGYNLERQWCDLCKGAGMIRNKESSAPTVADIRTFADAVRAAFMLKMALARGHLHLEGYGR